MAEQEKPELITGAEFARRMNCSRQAVSKAIKDGRFVKGLVQEGKRTKLDFGIAKLEWEENKRFQIKNTGKKDEEVPAAEPAVPQTDEPESTPRGSINQARQVKENYEARISKLKYETMAGQYISVEVVKAHNFKRSRILRDTILNIPDRISTVLAARLGKDIDAAIVHETMDTELRDILEELSKTHAANIPTNTE